MVFLRLISDKEGIGFECSVCGEEFRPVPFKPEHLERVFPPLNRQYGISPETLGIALYRTERYCSGIVENASSTQMPRVPEGESLAAMKALLRDLQTSKLI